MTLQYYSYCAPNSLHIHHTDVHVLCSVQQGGGMGMVQGGMMPGMGGMPQQQPMVCSPASATSIYLQRSVKIMMQK